jgi:uncharacterized protein (TIGR02145 family)
MKAIKLFIIAAIIGFTPNLSAQNDPIAIHYNGSFVSPGDTITISASEYYGTLQWQHSSDGINWSNIPDVTEDEFTYVVDENIFFRALVSDGECEPHISEALKINIIIMHDNVVLVDTVNTQLLSDSTQLSQGIYRYDWNESSSFFQVGDILIGSDGYGYLRKVTNAFQDANEWVANTEQATLEDAIEYIDLADSLQILLNGPDKAIVNGKLIPIKNSYFHPGISFDSKMNLMSLQDVDLISTNYFSAKILEGSLDFNPILHRALKISGFPPSLDYFKFSAGGMMEFNMDMEFKATAPYNESEDIRIFYLEIPVFNIGIIPVVAYTAIYIGYEIDLDITGTTLLNLDSQAGLEVGVEYDNGFNSIYEKTLNFDADLDWGATADVGAKIFVRPEFGMKIVGFASGYLNVEPYLRADAGVTYPNYDWHVGMYAGLDANIGCNVGILGFDLLDYDYTFANFETELYYNSGTLENKPPYSDFSFSQNMGYSGDGYMIEFTNKTKNGASSQRWDFGDRETSDIVNPVHVFARSGLYEIELISNNCYGSHTARKTIYVGPCAGIETVTDIDGNVYNTVQVGERCWLRENLKTTHYNDGTSINHVSENSQWNGYAQGAYCWYDNNEGANKNVYGALYNFEAASSGKLCPAGWSVPTATQWSNFQSNFETAAADKIRETGTTYWYGDNESSTNETNYSARAGGYRSSFGEFLNIKKQANWWTSTLVTAGVANSRTIWYNANNFDYVTNSSPGNGFSVRCIMDNSAPVYAPTVYTLPAEDIDLNSAKLNGKIVNTGGGSISDKGFVWSTSEYPTLETNEGISNLGSGSGDFDAIISGLNPAAVYYFRAYAINSAGTSYGNQLGITTVEGFQPCAGEPFIYDADGNEYATVQIGSQCWMAKNLATTKYSNNQSIATGLSNNQWATTTTGAHSIYPHSEHPQIDSESQMKQELGLLYNWYAVSSDSICPDGWHVSTNSDWHELQQFVGINIAEKLRSDEQNYWFSGGNSYNVAGFNAKAAGKRAYDGDYQWIKADANWWTSNFCDEDNSLSRRIAYDDSEFDTDLFKQNNEGYSVRCVRDKKAPIVLPLVSTYEAQNIDESSANISGSIISDGFGEISQRGFVWGTNQNPDIDNNEGIILSGLGIGNFAQTITGLNLNTTYYVRAFATNEAGTAYGMQVGFYTTSAAQPCLGIPFINDLDGNTYPTVQIGTQCWMAKNLRVSRYNDNSLISTALNNSQWSSANYGAYSIYPHSMVDGIDTDEDMADTYGYLYNFDAANSGNLCPTGWHVSTNSEWQTINAHLGENPSSKLREAGIVYWASPNDDATNESGFSARGAGVRSSTGDYENFKYTAGFWTASKSGNDLGFSRTLWYNSTDFDFYSTDIFQKGMSVRCVKDF